MITTQSQRQLAFLNMTTNGFSDSLANVGHKSWVLELANRRVVRGGDTLELVVSIKFDFPAKLGELLRKASLNKVNRTPVYTGPRLYIVCKQRVLYEDKIGQTWPPLESVHIKVSICG